MTTDIHLIYGGTCAQAFALYEQVFGTRRTFTMTFGEAPPDAGVPAGNADRVLHTTLPLGNIRLLGCDAPSGREETMGGFQISLIVQEESEVVRLFSALSEGGQVQMAPTPTFWSPLFGMCKDKYGVGWMVGLEGPQQQPESNS